jgi:chemotaxis protein methyltransferase CheR
LLVQAHTLSEPESIGQLAEIVEAHSGLRFVDSRRSELATKAVRALADHGCATLREYLGLLSGQAGAPLLDQLIEALTVGETYFFRHRPYFDLVGSDILPDILARRQQSHQLRAWCAGCASGEEAYSIAILLRQALPDPSEWNVAILATDINRQFLAQADQGTYGNWSFRETGKEFKRTYFTRVGTRYRIAPEIRRMVRFAHLNLAGNSYPSFINGTTGFDLIFCRNVLIYLGAELAERVLARLAAALVDGGCLVLGPSDPTPRPPSELAALSGRDAVVYRRAPGSGTPAPPPTLPRELVPGLQGGPSAHESTPGSRQRPASRPCIRPPIGPAPASTATAADDWRDACQLAREHANHGRLEDARAHCQQAIGRAALQPEPYYLMATLCDAEGDDKGALTAFRKAIYLNRGFTPAYLGMAAIHRRTGQVDLAQREISRAYRLLGDRPSDEVVLADEGLTVGRLRDALGKGLAPGLNGRLA